MKNFLYNLKNALSRLFRGCYGPDDLYKGCLFVIIILMILNSITRFRLFYILELILFVILTLRFFSKNHAARIRENEFYLKHTVGLRSWIKYQFKRIRNIRHYRYRKCPHCHQALRLPVKKGKHAVVCPKCHEEFETTILF